MLTLWKFGPDGYRQVATVQDRGFGFARAQQCGPERYMLKRLDDTAEALFDVGDDGAVTHVTAYDLFDGDGGHVGPYYNLELAVEDAKRRLAGRKTLRRVEVRFRDRNGTGGFGAVARVLTRADLVDTPSVRLRVAFFDDRGYRIEQFETTLGDALERIGRFVTLRGTDPDEDAARSGRIEFSPLED